MIRGRNPSSCPDRVNYLLKKRQTHSVLFSRIHGQSPREHEGTERDTEGVGCDMS